MAEDSQHWPLAEWLRARGALSGDGTKTGFHLQDWKDQGWEGETVEFRRWKKDTWATQHQSGSDWWSSGYEPQEKPASGFNAADWSDWNPTGKGGGKGGGGGGSTGSGHVQQASSSGGRGPVPKEEPASSSGGRVRSLSRNKMPRHGSPKGSSGS